MFSTDLYDYFDIHVFYYTSYNNFVWLFCLYIFISLIISLLTKNITLLVLINTKYNYFNENKLVYIDFNIKFFILIYKQNCL
jgi:hypothetical protein